MTPEPAAPPQLARATQLLWCSLGLGVIRTVFDWSEIAHVGPVAFVLPVMILTFAVVAFLIVMIMKRHNWARIAFLVLFVVGTLVNGHVTMQELMATPLMGLLSLAQIGLQGAGLYLLFRPPAAAWFGPTRPA